MASSDDFHAAWSSAPEIELQQPDEEPTLCVWAARFQEWCDELGASFLVKPDTVRLNQGKLLLLERYFDWRAVVPKSHRFRVTPNGHHCIWHVFEDMYLKLRAAELALTPPLLFLPAGAKPVRRRRSTPVPPPMPQIHGIVIGERVDEG